MVYIIVRILLKILGTIPLEAGYYLADIGAKLAYFLSSRDKKRAISNLDLAFGDSLSPKEKKKIIKEMFQNFAYSAVELLHFDEFENLLKKVKIEVIGNENIKEVLENGRGFVFCTAHTGNWELMGSYFAKIGVPVNVIARSLHDPRYEKIIAYYREKGGMKVLHRGVGTYGMIKCLKKGEGLGILFDQDTKGTGHFVEFFGQPAFTLSGPGVLALKTGSALIPGFARRLGKKHHQFVIFPEISLDKLSQEGSVQDEEALVVKVSRKLNQELERFIRESPSNWVWFHRRWKRKPDEK